MSCTFIIKAVIIDLGKSCLVNNGKNYKLSNDMKLQYKQKHPQIAPDLRDGICIQSKKSDVFSFGRILKIINEEKLHIPVLTSMSELCLKYSGCDRPLTSDLHTFLTNLL
jgi:hypothetical protein